MEASGDRLTSSVGHLVGSAVPGSSASVGTERSCQPHSTYQNSGIAVL